LKKVSIYLTESQLVLIKVAAEKEGLSLSSFLRMAALKRVAKGAAND